MEGQQGLQGASTLGKASLGLGIASAALVFGIGICALVGAQQGWINLAGTPLFVCGASSAFVGFLGVVTGIGALFDKQHTKTPPIVGLALSLMGMCLFLLFLSQVGG